MKVFSCRMQGDYAGGLIVVAANSKEEAFLMAAHDKRFDYMFRVRDESGEWFPISYLELKNIDITVENCYSEDYPFDKWHEEPLLTANVKTPQVIIEGSYGE